MLVEEKKNLNWFTWKCYDEARKDCKAKGLSKEESDVLKKAAYAKGRDAWWAAWFEEFGPAKDTATVAPSAAPEPATDTATVAPDPATPTAAPDAATDTAIVALEPATKRRRMNGKRKGVVEEAVVAAVRLDEEEGDMHSWQETLGDAHGLSSDVESIGDCD